MSVSSRMPYEVDVPAAVGRHGFGVYQIDGDVRARITQESGGRIDVERGANDDEDVGILHRLRGWFNHGYALAEEHDVGAEQRIVGRQGTRCHLAVGFG